MTTILTDWHTVCKLTDVNGQTNDATQWGPNVTNPAGVLSGTGGLCSGGFYHAYHTPEVAAFLNPAHAAFSTPRFWLAEIRGTVEEDHHIMKLGATEMRTVCEVPAITPTMRQRQVFAVCVAADVLESVGLVIPEWNRWAALLLAGAPAAAYAAYNATYAAAYAAANAATANAAYAAANAAAYAANATANATITNLVIAAATYALQEDAP